MINIGLILCFVFISSLSALGMSEHLLSYDTADQAQEVLETKKYKQTYEDEFDVYMICKRALRKTPPISIEDQIKIAKIMVILSKHTDKKVYQDVIRDIVFSIERNPDATLTQLNQATLCLFSDDISMVTKKCCFIGAIHAKWSRFTRFFTLPSTQVFAVN